MSSKICILEKNREILVWQDRLKNDEYRTRHEKTCHFTELDCLKTLYHNSTKITRQKPVRTYYILKMIPYYIIKENL